MRMMDSRNRIIIADKGIHEQQNMGHGTFLLSSPSSSSNNKNGGLIGVGTSITFEYA